MSSGAQSARETAWTSLPSQDLSTNISSDDINAKLPQSVFCIFKKIFFTRVKNKVICFKLVLFIHAIYLCQKSDLVYLTPGFNPESVQVSRLAECDSSQ